MPNTKSPRPYDDLPLYLRNDPAVVHWRLEIIERRVETRLDTIEHRVELLEARWHLSLPSSASKWPWFQIIAVLVLGILALTGHLNQADVLSIAKRSLGV